MRSGSRRLADEIHDLSSQGLWLTEPRPPSPELRTLAADTCRCTGMERDLRRNKGESYERIHPTITACSTGKKLETHDNEGPFRAPG